MSLAMIIGGAAGSTAGGIKMARVVMLGRGLRWRLRRLSLGPHELMRYELDGKSLAAEDAERLVESAGLIAVLWAVVLWISVFTLIHFVPSQFGLFDVILEVASAQSNVGLSTGITHPDLHWAGRLLLIVSMWLGRLEIVPAIVVASGVIGWWSRRRAASRA